MDSPHPPCSDVVLLPVVAAVRSFFLCFPALRLKFDSTFQLPRGIRPSPYSQAPSPSSGDGNAIIDVDPGEERIIAELERLSRRGDLVFYAVISLEAPCQPQPEKAEVDRCKVEDPGHHKDNDSKEHHRSIGGGDGDGDDLQLLALRSHRA